MTEGKSVIGKLFSGAAIVLATTVIQAIPVVQEWYVPQPEAQIRQDYLVLAPNTNTITESVIAITVPIPGTRIVLDHWENGYEVDLSNPVQSNTQIWGDGNDANGKPPGYANDPVSFNAGSVIIMRNQVPLPRNAATILFDGRDRFGSSNAIVMTRGAWFTTPGPLLANSVEVRAVPDWGTSFVLPVGEDVIFPTPLTSSMFEHCSAYIMAAANGTVVTVDVDGAGPAAATNVTLNQGESHLINAGIKRGATIVSTKGVQVMQFYGDIGANYEARGANIPPLNKWSDHYFAPVGTASDGDETYVYLYNNDAAATTVNFTTRLGSGSISIPAKSTYQYLMPINSAARFTSVGGKPFWGVGLVGARPTANNVHDWGYSLVPQDFLSTEIVVGWGAGSRDGTQNGNPVWITSVAATRLYVDYNGDRLGPNTDPNGRKYDVAIDVIPLAATRIFEPDRDQTGMRVYTLDGTQLTGAWGQDPATAGPGEPYLDLGNTTPNLPVPVLKKTSSIFVDNTPSGLSVNDVVQYKITLDNRSLFSLSSVSLVDVLPAGVTYVANSTVRDGSAVADAGTTAFPMDEGGLVVPILQSQSSTTITFRVTVNTSGTKVNTVSALGYPGVEAKDTIIVPSGGVTSCTLRLTNNVGTEVNFQPGDGIYVTVTDASSNTNTSAIESILATVSNPATGDIEVLTLAETTANSGVFRNNAALPSSTSAGLAETDGTLNVQVGNTISATHVSPQFGHSCPDTATINAASLLKQLYLDTDGTDGDNTGDLDRVSPAGVSPADTTTSQSAVISAPGTTANTYSTAGSSTWTVPAGVTSVTVAAWGAGGAGGGSTDAGFGSARGGAGGGGGAYASSTLSVTPGQQLTIVVPGEVSGALGAAGANGNPAFVGPDGNAANALVRAAGGSGGAGNTSGGAPTGGAGGAVANSVGTTRVAGVNGGNGASGIGISSGAGGAGAQGGGAGGAIIDSQGTSSNGNSGNAPGGAGGGSRTSQSNGSRTGGNGGPGRIQISYSTPGGSATWTQAPAFAETFNVTSTPGVTAHYTVSTGTMPGSPNISAVLRKNGVAFATSSSVSASAATGAGVFTFSFPALGSAVNFAAGDVMSLVISNNQSGVTFTVDYDSNNKPSLVTLPTDTVIHLDTLGIYDAPYPGGSPVTAATAGQTLYVRAMAADPFGAYDVTSMPLVIDGPGTAGDVSTTLGASQVVATTGNAKTYEYAWMTGATEGNFNITATAKEGFENTISSAKSTVVNISSLDLGTPSTTEFTTGNNGPHTLVYAPNETVFARVSDLDENTNPLVAETILVTIIGSGGDTEIVTLTETGPNTGIFTGGIPASSTVTGSSGNGTLYALPGSVPVVHYVDNDDATDVGSDTATIPNAVPSVAVVKTLTSPADGQILVGETAGFRIRVTNNGNTTLNTVQVVDTFANAELTYVAASPAPSSTTSNTLTWANVGPLAAGQSIDLNVTFTGAAAANPSINTVNVTTGGGPTANDTEPVIVTRPAVTVTKTLLSPDPGPANKGDQVVFNISVQNTGTTALQTVPLEDVFSDAFYEFVSASVAPDGVGAGSLLWNDVTGAGILAVNATFQVSVTLEAKGASAFALNTAAVNYAIDANGDPVPPSSDDAGVATSAASISGTVFEDEGVVGFGGDVPLRLVTVRLYTDPNGDGDPVDGELVGLTITNDNGSYEFLNLALGNYVITQEDLLGYFSVADTAVTNDNLVPLSVTAFTAYPNNNFLDDVVSAGDLAFISGQVRNDSDGDGNLADAEAGLAGAVVTLFSDPNGDGNPSDGVPFGLPITTTSTGLYTFSNLPPGNYVVVETDPAGFVSTADITNPNDNWISVTLVADTDSSGNDFIDTNNLAVLATVGDRIWQDTNNNGLRDGGEAGIDGVVVHLYRSGQTPGVDAPYVTTTSGSGGFYGFGNVPAGQYVIYLPAGNFGSGVLFNQPLSSASSASADDLIDNNDDGSQAGGTGTAVSSPLVTLSTGEIDQTKDFGFVPNSSLSALDGYLYVDADGDGNKEASEFPLENVRVFIDQNNDGVWQAGEPSDITDGTGFYSIGNLPPGDHLVTVVTSTIPSGVTQTGDPDVTLDHKSIVTLPVAQTVSNVNFGYQGNASIGDYVWNDRNGDGLQGATEAPLAGVRVFIDRDNDGTYDADEPFATTSASGSYSLAGLIAGTYGVAVDATTLPAGVAQTADPDGPVMDGITSVVLAAAQNFALADFGYQGNSGIGDYVWYDVDGDGVQDAGEPPLENVRVYLDSDDDGVWDANEPSALTTIAGAYSFDGLIPGTFLLRVDAATIPAGMTASFDQDGIATANRTSVVLAVATTRTDIDFGYEATVELAGNLYIDTNGNGDQDGGEPNLPDVDVLITDALGVERTVTTDSNGNWSVMVVAGNTTADIDETDPDYPTGFVRTEGNDPTVTNALVGTTNNGGIDGFYQPATLTGHLYIDTNGDGNQDVGEPNLANVNVLITDVNSNVQTVTTDSNGDWTAIVPPGSTIANIDESDPEYPTGYTQTEGTDPTNVLAVAGTSTSAGNDGFFLPASIKGFVRIDTDGNATGDAPQVGVLVELFTNAGVLVSSVLTGTDGRFSFPNLAPGSYKKVQTVPNNYIAVNDADGGDFTVIGNLAPVVLNAGDNVTDQNFVNTQFASITGNVFNDLNRLADNTVNGTGTNGGGIHINLVNPVGDIVLASIPVNVDGTYSFTQANGVQINSSYRLVLTANAVTIGATLTASTLPAPWFNTGENLGAVAGNDGSVNGILAVSTTVGVETQANFGIVQAPDITPVITAQPNVMNGPTDFNIRVQVNELYQKDTEGTIVVRIPKDARWSLREAFDGNLVELDGVSLENNKWTHSENETQHIFTTVNPGVVIPAGGLSRFGIKARWVAEAQEGIYTISVQVDSFSGNEIPINNNSDADKIDFFDK